MEDCRFLPQSPVRLGQDCRKKPPISVDFSKVPSPCYLIDENLLRANLEKIRYVREKAGVTMLISLKAFANWGVFPILREYGFGASASSLNEARLAFEELGVKAHTYCPAYKGKDFSKILEYSSHVTFNSVSQLERYNRVSRDAGVSVGLRVNPEFSQSIPEIYNPCAPGSRLGVTADKLGAGLPAEVEGLHFHALFEADSYILERLLSVFVAKFSHFFPALKWVNMGGGHLITKEGYDTEHLIGMLLDFRDRHGLEVILEPGSAFAYQAGYLVSTVVDVVENNGVKTALLDVSFVCHMPDCLEMPYKPNVLGATDAHGGKFNYRLGGISCLAGDFMGEWSFEKELKPGDRVVFEDMIHYTTVKTTMFNGIDHPCIGIWNDSTGFRLIREFGYEDYKNRLS